MGEVALPDTLPPDMIQAQSSQPQAANWKVSNHTSFLVMMGKVSHICLLTYIATLVTNKPLVGLIVMLVANQLLPVL
jgi:hypothetical protein